MAQAKRDRAKGVKAAITMMLKWGGLTALLVAVFNPIIAVLVAPIVGVVVFLAYRNLAKDYFCGNVTGITNLSRDVGGKRLELLKEAVPKLARVAVLHDPTMPGTARELKEELPVAAHALKLTLLRWEIRTADDFEKVFASLNKQRPDGLYAPTAGGLMRSNEKRIIGFALKSRLPSVYSSREAVDAGGLLYYGADQAESYQRVAYFVDKILKGAKPADLPVEQPTKFELVINLKTAKQIGVTIPQKVLARADKVIK